jgi:hypothetical protein
MIRKNKKLLIVSLILSILFLMLITVITFTGHAPLNERLGGFGKILSVIVFGSLYLGGLIGGNKHDTPLPLFLITMFLINFLLFFCLVSLWSYILRKLK